jgi:putative ATPase
MENLFDLPGGAADLDAAPQPGTPLADRMRPRALDEVLGQDHLIGPGKVLRRLIESGRSGSMILWGPPGSGKTSLARLIARLGKARFVQFSAVLSGIKEVKAVMEEAERHLRASGHSMLLFIDEIHRFNRAQQDAFLPHVEKGHIVLIGATTENPSFEVNSALLSRCRVYVLNALAPEHILALLRRALEDARGLAQPGTSPLPIAEAELRLLAEAAQGDARAALNTLEILAHDQETDPSRSIDRERVRDALQRSALYYDKGGEEHYNLISALHKSLRNSDADAALYWLARMLEAGEDPLYIARRLVRFASEDVGLADPQALVVANAARDAAHFIGRPEGDLALAQAAVHLAQAPKSNALYRAWGEAVDTAHTAQPEPVPLHLRNAPTALMRGLGYGRDYDYAHDRPEGVAPMECLPPGLRGRRFYRPSGRGFEAEVAARLERGEKLRRELAERASSRPGPTPAPPTARPAAARPPREGEAPSAAGPRETPAEAPARESGATRPGSRVK